jgi:hypothetical protein
MSLVGLRPARCLTCNRKFYSRYTLSDDGKYILSGSKGSPERREYKKAA